MLVDVQSEIYKLLKALGCDLAAVSEISNKYEFGVLVMEYIAALAFCYWFVRFMWYLMRGAFKSCY